MKTETKEKIHLASSYIGMILVVWSMTYFVGNTVSDYEIVKPRKNVECVVVSRMFNTSVSCYHVEEKS